MKFARVCLRKSPKAQRNLDPFKNERRLIKFVRQTVFFSIRWQSYLELSLLAKIQTTWTVSSTARDPSSRNLHSSFIPQAYRQFKPNEILCCAQWNHFSSRRVIPSGNLQWTAIFIIPAKKGGILKSDIWLVELISMTGMPNQNQSSIWTV